MSAYRHNLYAVARAIEQVGSSDYFMHPPLIGRGTRLPVDERFGFVVEFESCSTPLGVITMKYIIRPIFVAVGQDDFMSIYIQGVETRYPYACRAALAAAIRELALSKGQLAMATQFAPNFMY